MKSYGIQFPDVSKKNSFWLTSLCSLGLFGAFSMRSTQPQVTTCICFVVPNGSQCSASSSRCYYWCLWDRGQHKLPFSCQWHAKLLWSDLFSGATDWVHYQWLLVHLIGSKVCYLWLISIIVNRLLMNLHFTNWLVIYQAWAILLDFQWIFLNVFSLWDETTGYYSDIIVC